MLREIQTALNLVRHLNLKGEEADEVSKTAKRMFSMTITGGVVSSFLFAYSKAKNENIKKLYEDYNTYKSLDKEERNWGLVLTFLLKEALSGLNFKSDLVDVVSRLHDEDVRGKAEVVVLRYLDKLSRVLDAFS